jgi:hypothetical protein
LCWRPISAKPTTRARPTDLDLFVADLMKAGVGKDDVTKMDRELIDSLLMG